MFSPFDAAKAVYAIASLVGDARAWRLEVRKWCYTRGSSCEDALRLEAWVEDVGGGFAGLARSRREALRMWAYDQIPPITEARGSAADDLYRWAVEAESRATPDSTESDYPGLRHFADPEGGRS